MCLGEGAGRDECLGGCHVTGAVDRLRLLLCGCGRSGDGGWLLVAGLLAAGCGVLSACRRSPPRPSPGTASARAVRGQRLRRRRMTLRIPKAGEELPGCRASAWAGG